MSHRHRSLSFALVQVNETCVTLSSAVREEHTCLTRSFTGRMPVLGTATFNEPRFNSCTRREPRHQAVPRDRSPPVISTILASYPRYYAIKIMHRTVVSLLRLLTIHRAACIRSLSLRNGNIRANPRISSLLLHLMSILRLSALSRSLASY